MLANLQAFSLPGIEALPIAVFSKFDDDFADVRGQETAKRAIPIAAAERHDLRKV